MVEAVGERLDQRDAFEDFQKWARESNISIKDCNKNTFKNNMERIIGTDCCKGGKGKYWINWTFTSKKLSLYYKYFIIYNFDLI